MPGDEDVDACAEVTQFVVQRPQEVRRHRGEVSCDGRRRPAAHPARQVLGLNGDMVDGASDGLERKAKPTRPTFELAGGKNSHVVAMLLQLDGQRQLWLHVPGRSHIGQRDLHGCFLDRTGRYRLRAALSRINTCRRRDTRIARSSAPSCAATASGSDASDARIGRIARCSYNEATRRRGARR